jgi:DNA-binding NarL/FixJ family response regulator
MQSPPSPVAVRHLGATPSPGILVVEDDADIRTLIDLRLGENELSVVGSADNADAAIALAQELQPSIAVLDLSLRSSSGMEVLPELLRLGWRVVIYTAFTWNDAQTALDLGAEAAFLKLDLNEMIVYLVNASTPG